MINKLSLLIVFYSLIIWTAHCLGMNTSAETDDCISCHASVTPDIVSEWERSRHGLVTPAEALKKGQVERRVSNDSIPVKLSNTVVGCAECHTMNPENHKDTFEHQGYKVHVVVTPSDCAICHTVEADQYNQNIMSHAHRNLVKNDLYQELIKSINGPQFIEGLKIITHAPNELTNEDSCLFCHGTVIASKGAISRKTQMGDMSFPILSGWPNQGVGRINPDGSEGCCTSCHARHQFPIEMARKPYTCAECHKGPDVPAYKVYTVSKHGNVFSSLEKEWDFKAVPWTVGKDFTAPTCAVCHVSLVVNKDGDIIGERTHRMNDRLPWRLFGLIYAHPYPKSPDLTIIRNKAGLGLPTELSGQNVSEFLIDPDEMAKRKNTIQSICHACHGSSWIDGHWTRLENSIRTSNEMTGSATQLILDAWKKGMARGFPQKANPFDEAIEKKWVEQWLFFSNSVRFSSAMCGADYGAFENGRWDLSKNLREMSEWMVFHRKVGKWNR